MKYYNLKFKTENLQRKVELDTCTQNWKFSFKKILNLNNFKMKKKQHANKKILTNEIEPSQACRKCWIQFPLAEEPSAV